MPVAPQEVLAIESTEAFTNGYANIREGRGVTDQVDNLIHDLSRRLDCLGRYDQYIANADGQPDVQTFWRRAKAQDQMNIEQLKLLVAPHLQYDRF